MPPSSPSPRRLRKFAADPLSDDHEIRLTPEMVESVGSAMVKLAQQTKRRAAASS